MYIVHYTTFQEVGVRVVLESCLMHKYVYDMYIVHMHRPPPSFPQLERGGGRGVTNSGA